MDKLTPAFVTKWSAAYPLGTLETQLLNTTGPILKRRGYVKRGELLDIARWKARGRIVGAIDNNNSDWEIEETSRVALAAPQGLQHRILATLHGVNIRTATAILTVVDPDSDTVLDVRALAAIAELQRLGDVTPPLPLYAGGLPAYLDYLNLCQTLAQAGKCSLRELDRAMWTWEKSGLP